MVYAAAVAIHGTSDVMVRFARLSWDPMSLAHSLEKIPRGQLAARSRQRKVPDGFRYGLGVPQPPSYLRRERDSQLLLSSGNFGRIPVLTPHAFPSVLPVEIYEEMPSGLRIGVDRHVVMVGKIDNI